MVYFDKLVDYIRNAPTEELKKELEDCGMEFVKKPKYTSVNESAKESTLPAPLPKSRAMRRRYRIVTQPAPLFESRTMCRWWEGRVTHNFSFSCSIHRATVTKEEPLIIEDMLDQTLEKEPSQKMQILLIKAPSSTSN